MSKPLIRSGRFTAGAHLTCGENVVVDVAEEVVVGDRCVLPDNAYLGGRRVELGDDFFGYSWGHPAPAHVHARTASTPYNVGGDLLPFGSWLEVGRGRKDDEDAVLTVGSRVTMHNNRIDLARRVTIGDDVGLSPDVVIYTHGYWQSPLDGFPCQYAPVTLAWGVIAGFRSTILPGALVEAGVVIGAESVVKGRLACMGVYAGNPARRIRGILKPSQGERERLLTAILDEYRRSCAYRGLPCPVQKVVYPFVYLAGCGFNVETRETAGDEDERSDDFRWHVFTRGIRLYTKRPFRKLGRKV